MLVAAFSCCERTTRARCLLCAWPCQASGFWSRSYESFGFTISLQESRLPQLWPPPGQPCPVGRPGSRGSFVFRRKSGVQNGEERREDLRRTEFFQEFQKVFAEGVSICSILERGNIWGNGDFAGLYTVGVVAFMTLRPLSYTQRVAGSSPAPPTTSLPRRFTDSGVPRLAVRCCGR